MPTRTSLARLAVAVLALLALSAATAAASPARHHKPAAAAAPALDFLGQTTLPTGLQFQDTEVGGLSSITYDRKRGVYYALSDDQGTIDPIRFYTLRLDVADGNLETGDVTFTGVTGVTDPTGAPFPLGAVDPEGLVLLKGGRQLMLTSEGFAATLVPPFVRLFGLDGRQQADLPVPQLFVPDAVPQTRGVRQNLGFEAAATNGHELFTSSEGALAQDGPPAGTGVTSTARILRYGLKSGRAERQWVYVTDALADAPVPPTAFGVNGIVELLPVGKGRFIAMERSFSVGAPGTGNTIKLYLVDANGATDVRKRPSLAADSRHYTAVSKTLLLDLRTLGIPLDNVEGMTFGPALPDGRRSLVLVSDNNFAPAQFTQFLLFAYPA